MAGKGTIGGKIVLDGEKAYREALRNIKADQQELRSEMKLCVSEFKNSQNSLEALTKQHEILSKQVDVQTKRVEVYQTAMENSTKKQETAAEKVATLKAELEKAEKEMEAFSTGAGENADAVEKQNKTIENLKDKLEKAQEGYQKAEQKTKGYQTALNNATAELNAMRDDLNKTSQYMAEAEKSSNKCATSINEFGKETKEAAENTSVFGDVLRANIAAEVIIGGIKELASGIKKVAESAVDVGTSFSAAMSVVAATMGMTAEEINAGSADYERLAAAAKKSGAETKYSATEAAEALNYLALAGYDVNKSVETLPKVLNLAAAGGMDLAYASDLVTDAMSALGMETGQLDQYIDEMAKTSQKSNTNVAQLGEATLVCAGTVSLTKQKLETMNTELGILANNGIKGAEGGTHLRNILLSLSAPTDTASSAIEQLGIHVSDSSGNMRDLNDIMTDLNAAMSNMSAVEKTGVINRIFNKTDIAAANALLKGTGDEYKNLNKEINNCSGAAKNMADTMNNNLKGDVVILQSALEGLGIAAQEIFDKDMRLAVQGATNAVDKLQRAVTKGGLGVSLNKLSKAMGEFCENALELGEDVLPVAIDGLTWILDNADVVAAGIVGISAAHLQMNTIGPAITAAQQAWMAYKSATDNATVSQWLLTAAMDANPAGILITAIAGLTAAVAAYVLINKDNLSAMTETAQKTKELVESSKELNAEYENSRKSREQSRTGMEQEAAVAKKLVDELDTLRKKTSLTAAEQVRQKQIVEELNTVYPKLNIQLDEQTGLLNLSTDAIYANIEALAAIDKANAAREDMTRIAEEQWEAEKRLAELQEQRTAQAEELAEATKKLNEYFEESPYSYEVAARSAGEYAKNVNQAQTALNSLDEEIKNTNGTINSLSQEYQNCYDYISKNEGIYETAQATGQLGDAAQAAGADISGMATEATKALQEMCANLTETVQSQLDIFAEFKSGTELTTSELLKNMQSQIDGITEWADNMETLADRGINQGLLQHLADMGPEGAGYVATFVQMTDEELKKANELFEQSLQLPEDTAESVTEAYRKAGENAAEGFKLGIKDSTEEVVEEAKNMSGESERGVKTELGIQSPSRVFREIGQNIGLGMKQGINMEKPNVVAAIATLCSEVLLKGKSLVTTDVWEEIGRRIPEGMKKGIESGSSAVSQAVEQMAARAVEAARKELDIHSPSKKFQYLGEMSGAGYLTGWQGMMANAENVMAMSLPGENIVKNAPKAQSAGEKKIEVHQEINIYTPTNDPIEESRRIKNAQREAAEEW